MFHAIWPIFRSFPRFWPNFLTFEAGDVYNLAIMVTATRSKAPRKVSTKSSARTPARKRPARTYDSALKYLFTHTDYERMLRVRYNADTFSLERMRLLLKKLGNPH